MAWLEHAPTPSGLQSNPGLLLEARSLLANAAMRHVSFPMVIVESQRPSNVFFRAPNKRFPCVSGMGRDLERLLQCSAGVIGGAVLGSEVKR